MPLCNIGIINGEESRYSEMNKKLKAIKQGVIELLIDEETSIVYYGKCIECDKPLTLEEKAYGHDCE